MANWHPGEPPEGYEAAWLRVEEPNGDGECTLRVVLGVHDGEHWSEAGDYRAESYLDPIVGNITGWLNYQVPSV